jgi:hypothetical protein
MMVALWIAVALLGLVNVAVLLILAGLVRRLDDPRPTRHGSPISAFQLREAPPFEGRTLDAQSFHSVELRGTSHLILFAHPDCKPCNGLVAEMAPASALGRLPPLVLITRDDGIGGLARWQRYLSADSSQVWIVTEDGEAVSKQFSVSVRPYAFAVDETGHIVASGVPNSVDDLTLMAGSRSPSSTVPEAGR